MASSSVFPPVPQILKPIQMYMKVATDVEKSDPIVAYWCRFYALQMALKIDSKSKESREFIIPVMDYLEKEKMRFKDNEAITNDITASAHLENYALKLFTKADNDDRAGNSNKSTFKLFLMSAYLFDVLIVFCEIPEEIMKRSKYAKWKATYINKCIRNGETPIPGPMAGTDAEEFLDYGFDNINDNDNAQPSNSSQITSLPSASASNVPAEYYPASNDNEPSSLTALNGVLLDQQKLVNAQKYCKFAGSALQYEDVTTAVENLEKALSLLKTGNENV